jgi:hypothetical protein
MVQDTYHRARRAKAFVFHVRTSLLHPQSEFPRYMHYWSTSYINSSILTWTYHVFNKLKVVIMGNGYDVLSCDILETFLLARLGL